MLNDDVMVDKAEKVKAAIVCDLVSWASNDNAFANQFASFITSKHPDATYNNERMVEATTHAMMMLEKEPIYRIRVNEDTSVDTDCYDLLENFAPELKQRYDSVTSLPEWVQERLSVLMVLDPDKVTGEVTGIGRRINKRVFWVYKNGNDPRSEGQEGSPQTT